MPNIPQGSSEDPDSVTYELRRENNLLGHSVRAESSQQIRDSSAGFSRGVGSCEEDQGTLTHQVKCQQIVSCVVQAVCIAMYNAQTRWVFDMMVVWTKMRTCASVHEVSTNLYIGFNPRG